MPISVTITLNSIVGTPGPFSLYSNIDSYTTPFETGVLLATLQSGYNTSLVPNGTTIVKIVSNGGSCSYEIVKSILGLPTPTPTPTPNCVFDVSVTIGTATPTPTPTSTPIVPTPTSTPIPPTSTLVPPTPTITTYTIELRMTGMEDREGSFVLWQSSDGINFVESVTLTTIGANSTIQSFNGTPGYYYYYVVTKTSGPTCKVNVYNNVFDGLLGDFNPGPINGVVGCGDDTKTTSTFQLPDPKQSRSYISFNGTLDIGCI